MVPKYFLGLLSEHFFYVPFNYEFFGIQILDQLIQCDKFYFLYFFNCEICLWLTVGAIFLGRGRLKNCFGVYSCSLNNSYFYIFCIPNFWFWGPLMKLNQLSFSLFLSILTFDFDLILGSFFTFCGSSHVVKQILILPGVP